MKLERASTKHEVATIKTLIEQYQDCAINLEKFIELALKNIVDKMNENSPFDHAAFCHNAKQSQQTYFAKGVNSASYDLAPNAVPEHNFVHFLLMRMKRTFGHTLISSHLIPALAENGSASGSDYKYASSASWTSITSELTLAEKDNNFYSNVADFIVLAGVSYAPLRLITARLAKLLQPSVVRLTEESDETWQKWWDQLIYDIYYNLGIAKRFDQILASHKDNIFRHSEDFDSRFFIDICRALIFMPKSNKVNKKQLRAHIFGLLDAGEYQNAFDELVSIVSNFPEAFSPRTRHNLAIHTSTPKIIENPTKKRLSTNELHQFVGRLVESKQIFQTQNLSTRSTRLIQLLEIVRPHETASHPHSIYNAQTEICALVKYSSPDGKLQDTWRLAAFSSIHRAISSGRWSIPSK